MEDVLIPMVAILFPVFIIFIVFFFVFTTDYKKEKLRREERMKAIEAGVELPPEPAPKPLEPLDYLRKGLTFLAVGLGILIGVGIFFNKGLLGIPIQFVTIFGFVLTLIGIGLVIFYKIQSKSEK